MSKRKLLYYAFSCGGRMSHCGGPTKARGKGSEQEGKEQEGNAKE